MPITLKNWRVARSNTRLTVYGELADGSQAKITNVVSIASGGGAEKHCIAVTKDNIVHKLLV